MTYILGWKNYNSVFLVGDSVVTIDYPGSYSDKTYESNRPLTSFGEQQIFEKGKTISEKWLKLYDLENKVILAISGTIEEAHEGIKHFKMYLEIQNVIDILKAVENSFSDKDVKVLIGYMDENVPRLISYNGKNNSRIIQHDFFEVAHSGSIGESFINQTENFFAQIEVKGWSDEQILASIIAVTQSYGVQEEIIRQGVGGFFSGIRINKNGVTWQPDIMFVPFSYNGEEINSNQLAEIFGEAKRVLIQVRESVLFSCSPFIEDIKHARRPFGNFQPPQIIGSEEWYIERLAWSVKWGSEVNRNCDEHKAEYYIFYNTEKPIVGMIFDEWKKPFRISEDTIYFGEDLIALVEDLFCPQDEEFTLYIGF
ncbi:hypothetical protein SAMN04489724_1746 [Algoriphagus locisalis]|uniref:Uncharacterized protein n=1 Tax=Algoriphagus locisalis TaxID=305507 RepID=A0A1I7A811_9BACT|nr:hypothetical protein [Algoriphagus locisalis]SFT71083.1 hypothetical protein SAMN04489724_1746 [Algoriphagus locisalis]